MEWLLGAIAALLVALIWRWRQRAGVRHATVNYLIPGEDDEPLTPREAFVAGINRMGICGEHRQKIAAKLRAFTSTLV